MTYPNWNSSRLLRPVCVVVRRHRSRGRSPQPFPFHGVIDIRPRWFARNLESALKVLPVTVVTGARQTGKTTLVKSLGPERVFFTPDDVGVLDQAERHPDALLSQRPVTLDEVQRTPSLLLAVKRAVDERRRAGDFLLTGSANLLLLGRVADTLAGRAIYLELPPFCPAEWQQRRDALRPLDRLFARDFDQDGGD